MKHLKIVLAAGTLLSLFGCGQAPPAPVQEVKIETPDISKPVENITPTDDQQRRRLASEAICVAHNIPIYNNRNALFVASEDSVTIRTKEEVVNRALALCFIELKSESAGKAILADFDKHYQVMQHLTEAEKAFILAEHPTAQDMSNANWRAEGTHVMLWALGYIDSLSFPDAVCNVTADVDLISSFNAAQFRDKAKLRSKKEILDQADLILRYDWACTSANLQQQNAPGNLNPEVVMERHVALNWLINYMNQAWDDVSPDT